MTDAELESLGLAESKRLNMELRHDPNGGFEWEYDDDVSELICDFYFLDSVYHDPSNAFRDFGEFIAGCRAACGFDALRDATLEEAAAVAEECKWGGQPVTPSGMITKIADAILAKKGAAK